MADRPILFSGPMVRAILEGRKTQTRRVLKKPPWAQSKGWPDQIMSEQELDGSLIWYHRDTGCATKLPIPQPGDRLWVREAWRTGLAYEDLAPSEMGGEEQILYEADGATERWWKGSSEPGRFRQGMHMPRWASRLTLTVTDVRVQRLQEISGDDAKAEGIGRSDGRQLLNCYGPDCPTDDERSCNKHGCWGCREDFRDLWDSLNASRGLGWDQNPWVAAYTFTADRRNIDVEA